MITRDTIKNIASLARLELNEEELETYTHQLGQILDYVEKLNQLKTDDIEATAHAVEIATPMREDEVQKSNVYEDILNIAPDHEDQFFRVPKVI